MMKKTCRDLRPAIGIALWILLSHAAGFIGSLIVVEHIDGWYALLNKPTWTPPNTWFMPIWITLYTFMGVAAFLVCNKKHSIPQKRAIQLFVFQLVLNALWTPLFFGAHAIGLSLVLILLLDLFVVLTIRAFYNLSKGASYLLLPYLAWILAATALNAAIWSMN